LEGTGNDPIEVLSDYLLGETEESREDSPVKVAEDLAEIRKEANTVACRTLAKMTESLLPSVAEFLFGLCLLSLPQT